MPRLRQDWWRRRPARRWRPIVRALLWAVLGLAAAAGFAWLWRWGVPQLYGNPDLTKLSPADQLKAVTDSRTALLAGLAALAALGGLTVTVRTYRLTQQGQITDRYTKAIEQLGDEKLDIRLGGIYALERLAVDSERDHPTIVEVLSAYAREHARLASTPALRGRQPWRLGEDVQAVVTVLGRLPARKGVSRGDLHGANLTAANLGGAPLNSTDRTLALLGAPVELVPRGDFHGANLTGANLDGVILAGANLTRATLIGASLRGADLTGAILWGKANLTGAQLFRTDLTGANLAGANLTEADLGVATLNDAILTEANLTAADLTSATLTGANLSGANLTRAAGLHQWQLDSAKIDEQTILPRRLREDPGQPVVP